MDNHDQYEAHLKTMIDEAFIGGECEALEHGESSIHPRKDSKAEAIMVSICTKCNHREDLAICADLANTFTILVRSGAIQATCLECRHPEPLGEAVTLKWLKDMV